MGLRRGGDDCTLVVHAEEDSVDRHTSSEVTR